MWTLVETEFDTHSRAIIDGYLVFLRLEPSDTSRRKQKRNRSTGDWYIHFLIPEEERQKAYLSGEGFSSGTSLERAQELALEKAGELRGALLRKQGRR